MESQFDISIIIVNWNTKNYLINCLKSIEETSFGLSLEVIVVDNCSSDGSQMIVTKNFPCVKLIQNTDNYGFARGNNIGIAKSTGRYICLVNSDVVLLKDCLKEMVFFMDKHPAVGMSAPKILNENLSVQETAGSIPILLTELGQALFLDRIKRFANIFPRSEFSASELTGIKKVPFIYGCFWMVSRLALNNVGLLDERFFMYGEDIDWCKRFNDAGYDIVYYEKSKAIHFGCASSSNYPEKFYVEMKKSRLIYFEKYYGKKGAFFEKINILIHSLIRFIFLSIYTFIFLQKREYYTLIKNNHRGCIKWLLFKRIP